MGSTRARTPKNFVLEERLERYRDAIEYLPASFAGRWAEACWPLGADGGDRFREVRLDLGCGKGSFLVAAALAEPDVLFIGVDVQPVCIAYAAQRIVESGVRNALVVPGNGERLAHMFAAGELSAITLNFPTPHPRKREAHERLTTVDNLLSFRPLLAADGTLTLRTDSEPLYDYSRPQFEAAGYRARWTSNDTRAEHPDIPWSEYEERLAASTASVRSSGARPMTSRSRRGASACSTACTTTSPRTSTRGPTSRTAWTSPSATSATAPATPRCARSAPGADPPSRARDRRGGPRTG